MNYASLTELIHGFSRMLPRLTLSLLKRNQPKVTLPAALVRTVQHLIPVLRPGFTPGHLTSAGLAQLAGQVLFVAFEAGFSTRFFAGIRDHMAM
jgi:hypothetical protein